MARSERPSRLARIIGCILVLCYIGAAAQGVAMMVPESVRQVPPGGLVVPWR